MLVCRRCAHVVVSVGLFLAAFSQAGAQDKKKPVEFSADLGFLNTSGNTDVTAFNVGDKFTVRSGRWEHLQQFGSIYGSTDGKESSNLIFANLRSDFALAKALSLFGFVGFDRNRFAGIAQRFEEAVGVAWKIVATNTDQWNLEAGLAENQQKGTTGSSTSFTSLRTMTMYKHHFSKASNAYQAVEFLPNLNTGADYRVNTETGLVAPLSTHISMKAAYVVRFDNQPETGKKKSDRIFTTGLQFNW